MTWQYVIDGFGKWDIPQLKLEESKEIIIAIPFVGCDAHPLVELGPFSIIGSSKFIEYYDIELGVSPLEQGCTTILLEPKTNFSLQENLRNFKENIKVYFNKGERFLIILGGDRVITVSAFEALCEEIGEVAIVGYSGYADFLKAYKGQTLTSKTRFFQLYEQSKELYILGVKTVTKEEYINLREKEVYYIEGQKLSEEKEAIEDVISVLKSKKVKNLYLSVAINLFPPYLIRSWNNIDPGGIEWYPFLRQLRRLFEEFNIVAVDITDFAPVDNGIWYSSVMLSQLILKIFCYKRCIKR